MKTKDPIVQDVRTARERLFKDCEENLDKLLDHYHQQEPQHKDRLVMSKEGVRRKNIAPGPA